MLKKGKDDVDSFCQSIDTAVVDMFGGPLDTKLKRTYTEHIVISMLEAGISWKEASGRDLKKTLREAATIAAGDFQIPSVVDMIRDGVYNQFGCLIYGNEKTKRSFTM